jgi:hypothetical protein
MVQLGDEWWPAASVAITKRPNYLVGRGIGLSGPAGNRFVSMLPGFDPAIWWVTMVDRVAVAPLEQALAANATVSTSWPRLPPLPDQTAQGAVAASFAPGWYADPWRPGGWRWWDGTRWSEHQR